MSDGFEGDEGPTFDIGTLTPNDFRDRCFVVGVSGIALNKWGHVLLEVGGHYFHVSRPGTTFPLWMNFTGLKRYFKENDKIIFYRERIDDMGYPAKALKHLGESLRESWAFWLSIRNCVTFAEETLRAGGSKWDLEPHLPSYGPVRHSTGFMDLAPSSPNPAIARDQRGFWSLEQMRRNSNGKYQGYMKDHTPVSFRFWHSDPSSRAYQDMLDAK